MPSGSHGGTPGSHFGGGGSSSGSNFGSGNSFGGGSNFNGGRFGGPMRGPIGPHRFMLWPRGPVFVVTGRGSGLFGLFLFFAIFALCISFMTGVSASSLENNLKKVEKDYNHYQTMISIAKNDSSYIREATVTDISIDKTYDMYFIYYEIELADEYKTETKTTLIGWSYPVYTQEEAFNLKMVVKKINVAVSDEKVNLQTDSIPLDYENTKLEDDSEYVVTLKSYKTASGWTTGLRVTAGILFTLGIVCVIATAKREKQAKESGEGDVSFTTSSGETKKEQTTETTSQEQSNNEVHIYCDFCGGEVSKKTAKCPHCGAKLKF